MDGRETEQSASPFMMHSPWLRHLRNDVRQPWDVTLEAYQEHLEAHMLGMANQIADTHGVDVVTARQNATNLLVAGALEMQREHSPHGQTAMVRALVSADPGLAGFRRALGMAGYNAERRAYWRGTAMGLVISSLVMGLASLMSH